MKIIPTGFLLSLTIGLMGLMGCTHITEPSFKKVEGIALKGFSPDGPDLEVKLVLENPNAKDIKIISADLEVIIDNTQIGTLSVGDPMILKANTESVCLCSIKINAKANQKFGIKTIGKITRGEISICLRGPIEVQVGILRRTICIDSVINGK